MSAVNNCKGERGCVVLFAGTWLCIKVPCVCGLCKGLSLLGNGLLLFDINCGQTFSYGRVPG